MSVRIHKYFDFNIWVLKCAGMWTPDDSKSITRVYYLIYTFFWLTYSFVIYTTAELLCFSDTVQNMEDFVKNVSITMSHIVAVIKICIWFFRRKEILGMIDTLNNYSGIYDDFEDFKPRKSINEERITKDRTCKLLFYSAASVSLSAIFPYVKRILTESHDVYVVDAQNETVLYYETVGLPYFSRVPFEYTSSKLRYTLAILFQFLPTFNIGVIIVAFDTLYFSLQSYVSAHFLVIQGAFKTLRYRCLERLNLPQEFALHDSKQVCNEMNGEMAKISQHLEVILHICNRLEEIYTYITLAQTLMSLIIYCTCLYLIRSLTINTQTCAELAYLIAIELQLWMYCLFGNKVTVNAENIQFSIYEGDWFSADGVFKRSMLINMQRMLKPIHFTIGKFSPLTLTTFVSINKGAYTVFAVLQKYE